MAAKYRDQWRILGILLIGVLLLVSAACGRSSSEPTPGQPSGAASGQQPGTASPDGEGVVPGSLPTIEYTPASISFTATEGGGNPPSQVLNISNSGSGDLIWSVRDDAPWLSLSPISGSSTGRADTDTVRVSANIAQMNAGNHNTTITISAPGSANTPRSVPVNLILLPRASATTATIANTPASIGFTASQGGANPPGQNLTIWNSGIGDLAWTVRDDATWLTLSPISGSSTGQADSDTVRITVNVTGVRAGSHVATITISAPGATNSPRSVPVSLTILPQQTGSAATIAQTPASISFNATQGGANPASQTLNIWNSGTGNLIWSVRDDAAWLTLSPINGRSSGVGDRGTVRVSVSLQGLNPGNFSGTITISSAGATNTPRTIPVNLIVLQGGGGGGGGGSPGR